LAAARLVARGRTVSQIAAEMGISRQALWKWRRQEAFVIEVRRLHELLSRESERVRRV
jgi:transposase-like protein